MEGKIQGIDKGAVLEAFIIYKWYVLYKKDLKMKRLLYDL